nr:hypothetical protein [Tanacetum cinerariifolium]
MSTSTHPITILSDTDIEDAFSYTNTPNYTLASPDYFPASLGNTSFDPSEDLSKYLLASLAILPFHYDPYMKVIQAYNATSNESLILPQLLLLHQLFCLHLQCYHYHQCLIPEISFFLNGFYHLKNKPIPDHPPLLFLYLKMAPKMTSTSTAPTMTQAAIRKLVADSVATALEAQAATMTNTDNTNRNTR